MALLCCKICLRRERLALNYMFTHKVSSSAGNAACKCLLAHTRSRTLAYSVVYQAHGAHLCRCLPAERAQRGKMLWTGTRLHTLLSRGEKRAAELRLSLHSLLGTSAVNLLQSWAHHSKGAEQWKANNTAQTVCWHSNLPLWWNSPLNKEFENAALHTL